MAINRQDQLRIVDGLLTVTDEKRLPLLAGCSAGLQLSNGVEFSLKAMETIHYADERDAVVTGGGDAVLPRMEWRTELLGPDAARVSLTVTNTTPEPLPIERLDVLVCPSGYRQIPTNELYFRRTGWQSFSPANVRQPFESNDPWLQPPVQVPILPPTGEGQRRLAWMTVLQSDDFEPLLAGFGSAKDYLGMIKLHSDMLGHRLSASNYLEGVELAPGATIVSEPLLLMWGRPEVELLSAYGDYINQAMVARTPEPPTGWCSWYYYFRDFKNVTEADVLANLKTITDQELPLEYVQIDDGYQTMFGDWLSVDKQYFPHGMKYVADKIRTAGRKPGIWLAPFMADERSDVYQQHPNWFLRDASGRPLNVNRHGDPYWPAPNYGLDLTHPEAYAWIKGVLQTICHDWGYEYIKVDFLYAAAVRAQRHDPSVTSVQAYRRGMELIREVAGDRFVLGCGAPLLCSVGTVDAMRVNSDIAGSHTTANAADVTIPLSRDSIASLWSHAWMNGKLWVNDPDAVRVRQHDIGISWDEVQALAVLVALGGGSVLNGDNLASLEPEGLELMRRLLPVASVQARAVGKQQKRPSKLAATVERGDGRWYLAARFNWSDETKPFRFLAPDWELPVGRYHMYDLLRKRYIGTRFYQRSADIPAYGAGLLSLCAAADHPQVVASEGHLLGPAGDIKGIGWRDNELTIQFVDGCRPTKIFVHVPLTYRLVSQTGCEVADKVGGVLAVVPTADGCSLRFKPRLSLSFS